MAFVIRLSAAQEDPSNAGIVVAGCVVFVRSPVVDMHVLHLSATVHDGGREEDMVKLLGVLVEDVCVALDGVEVRCFVDLGEQVVERGEDSRGLDVFIEVSADNDVRSRVQCEQRLHPCLRYHIRTIRQFSKSLGKKVDKFYRDGLHLLRALCYWRVDGRTSVTSG